MAEGQAEDAPRELILGSTSPRRADLLSHAGYTFRVESAQIDEEAAREGIADGDIVAATAAIARAKFDAFTEQDPAPAGGSLLLTADTLVACQGATMGKPDSADAVATMLSQMSGQRLSISTAVCVGEPGGQPQQAAVSTIVELAELTMDQISRYVATNVGLDKAAGLALQSDARPFIVRLDRCWSNVLGLPLCAVQALMQRDVEATSRYCTSARCGSYQAD